MDIVQDILLFIPYLVRDIAVAIWSVIKFIGEFIWRFLKIFLPLDGTESSWILFAIVVVIIILSIILKGKLGGFIKTFFSLLVAAGVFYVLWLISPIGCILTIALAIAGTAGWKPGWIGKIAVVMWAVIVFIKLVV